MAKNKFYVVWKGRTPGVYDRWEDCKKEIEGFA
ncbi:MAG: RNase H1/viroplasmin domain-containing protein, partial [Prevotella sp.]|nr:RNase H1/viroplasmin domain-containing protein [Prevotella sp.]